MDGDTPYKRPEDQSDEQAGDEQSAFLDDLTSLFDEDDSGPDLPHWSESSESEAGEAGGAQGWEVLTGAAPRWRDDADDYASEDRAMAAEASRRAESVSVFEDLDPTEAVSISTVDQVMAGPEEEPSAPIMPGVTESPRPSAPPVAPTMGRRPPQRDLSAALLVGLLLGGLLLAAVAIGEEATLVVLTVALVVAAAEWFSTLRRGGYQPPVLVGLVAVAVLPVVAYWRGSEGIVLVLVFALFAASTWHLSSTENGRLLPNLGVTLLGVMYIGVTGAFGGLILDLPDGTGLILSAVILTTAHDVGAFVVGRAAGRTPLSDASPNKTVEGLIGGVITTIAAALVFIVILDLGPVGDGSGSDGVVLGIVVAVVAPLADLIESAIKRDLGVKDMSSLLPGHGGVLDRIDALLFVLPATYFAAFMLDVV